MENNILFRCSSLGHLMTEAKNKTEPISETTKTHLIDIFVSNKYNRFTEIHAKQLDKGNDTEEDSITIVSRITKEVLKKNTEHLSNEFIKGTPDIYIGKSIQDADIIRDTKSSWDCYSFFRSKGKALNKMYYWQIQGYMWLTDAKVGYIDYCLNNTPYHILEGELRKESYNHEGGDTPNWIELQIIANHVYDLNTFEQYMNLRGCLPIDDNSKAIVNAFVEIPLAERYFNFEVKRNDMDIERLKNRIIDCREYIKTDLFNGNK